MSFQNSTTRLKALQKAKDGVGKHFSNVGSLTLGGVTVAPADLMVLIQAELDSMAATGKLKADVKTQLVAEQSAHDKVEPLLRALKAYVLALYGATDAASSTLQDFGYTPRKSSKKTLATKVEASVKTKATRAARHTAGTKQKQAIKGTVPATPPLPKA